MLKNISYLLAGCIGLYSCGEKQQSTEQQPIESPKDYSNVSEVPDIIRLGHKGPIKSITSEISYLWQADEEPEVLIENFDKKGMITSQLIIKNHDTSTAKYVYENNRLNKVLLYDQQKRLVNLRYMVWETPYKYTSYHTEQDTANWKTKIQTQTNVFFLDSFRRNEFKVGTNNKVFETYYYHDTNLILKKHISISPDTSYYVHIYLLKDNFGNPGKEYIINDKTSDTTIIKSSFEYYQ